MKVLVACSGGIKSAFLTAAAVKEEGAKDVSLVYIGHNAEANDREQDACTRLAEHFNLDRPTQIIMSDSASGWPIFKTTLMYWYLLMHARANHYRKAYVGYSKDRHNVEMTEEFVNKLRMLTSTIQPITDGCGFYIPRAEIEIPLARLDLKRIIRLGQEYDTPWHLTWSCERADHVHCGTCKGCMRRQRAFILAGVTDNTLYRLPLARQGEKQHDRNRNTRTVSYSTLQIAEDNLGSRSEYQRIRLGTLDARAIASADPGSVRGDISTDGDKEVQSSPESHVDDTPPECNPTDIPQGD